jgi:hypothetical protein
MAFSASQRLRGEERVSIAFLLRVLRVSVVNPLLNARKIAHVR